MNLEELYQQIYNNIKRIKFDSIWKGFAPTKFALYNETECFFDGKYIEKTSDFVANTAIFYEGEYIAIWNVMGTPNACGGLHMKSIISELRYGTINP